MIPLFSIKILFIVIIILFLIGMLTPMMIIKKKGADPHGTHEGSSLLTRLTPVTIFSWLLYGILFLIFDNLILNFLVFDFLTSDIFTLIGMIVISLGLLLDAWGTVALGLNFRIELPKEDTTLITTGIYRVMRNPIVMGVFLLVIGSFLIIPTLFSFIFLVANVITFDSKVRDEEKFLTKRFGSKFEEYSKKVGRYFPFRII